MKAAQTQLRVGVFLSKEISGVKTIYPHDQHSTWKKES